MVLLSFVGIQKIWIFTKFGGCSSKIEPATPILILKFKRAWQTQFFSHTLQILVNDRFFIGHQMIFYSIFCISNRKAEIWEKLLFLFLSSPQVVKKPMIMNYNYHLHCKFFGCKNCNYKLCYASHCTMDALFVAKSYSNFLE